MYEQAIRDLGSIFRKKRESALQYLRNEVLRNPRGVVEDFVKYASQRSWEYAPHIFGVNAKGVYFAALGIRISPPLERILRSIGYAAYIPKIRDFWKLYDKISNYRAERIGVSVEKAYKLLVGGNLEGALEEIRREAEKGRELKRIKKKYEEYLALARECGERIESVGVHIRNGNIEEAKRAIERINGEELRRKVRLVREKKELEEFLREFLWIPRCKEFLAEAEKKSSVEEIRKIKIEAENFVRKVKEILQLWDDGEIRNLIKEDLERARRKAVVKRGIKSLGSTISEEIYTKEYSASVYSVHGFEAGGRIFILAGGKDNKLHVYDELGNELFTKVYFFGYVGSVHGFEAAGRVYILVGVRGERGNTYFDKYFGELNVYDMRGNELFSKRYSDYVLSVWV